MASGLLAMQLPWGLNLKHAYLAFFSVVSIALCSFSMMIYTQYAREQSLGDQTVYLYETMRQTRVILIDAIDMETGVRGYIISGDKRFLEPYDQANARLRDEILALRNAIYYERNAFGETNLWLNKVERLQTVLAAQVDSVKRYGRGSVSQTQLDQQKAVMDELRELLKTSIDTRAAKLHAQVPVARSHTNDFLYLLVIGTVLGVGILLAGTILVIRLSEENQRAEEEKNRAESRFKTVLNGVNDGLYELNFINDYMYMSPEFMAMLGYEDGELSYNVQTAVELIHPDDKAAALEAHRKFATLETPRYHNVFRMRHKDGSWRWMLSRGVGTWDKFGQIRSMVGTHTDITDQKEREEELQHLNAEMEAFTYITSHDMRAPLVNLKGFSHELRLGADEIVALLEKEKGAISQTSWTRLQILLREDIPEALDFIGNGVDRMDTLTTAMLDLSRIGRFAYREELVSAQRIFDKCLGAQSYEITQKGVDVQVTPLPELVVDPLALEQIFSNLLDNAVKYLRPDAPGKIVVACQETARDYIFSIRDNGRGIDPEDRERIFQIFRRARNCGEVRGMGLGMAFVKTTLRKISGSIWFDSAIDQGTTFYIRLPKKAAKSEESLAA